MMDDVVGLSGLKRHVEGVKHDAGLQIGREGPSDDPARPGVENDREVEKAGQRHRQLESAMRARNTPLGFSSAQIATLALEMSRQTVKARSRVVRRSSAVAFS